MSAAEHSDPATPRPRLPRTFASLGNRTFRTLLLGWLAAGTGYWMQLIALTWLVLTLTDSPAAVGLVTAVQFLPALLLGLHGGALVDVFPRRRILLVTQCAKCLFAAVLAVLTATGRVEVWQVYCVAVALGVVYAVDQPARQSLLSETVHTDHLRNAISLVSLAYQMGAVVGPALSGILMVAWGTEYAFGAAALAYLLPAFITARLPVATSETRVGHAARSGIRAGLRYAVRTPTVFWPTLMVGSFGFFMVSLPVTLATLAKNEFQSGATGAGLLSSSVAAGSLFGALIIARRARSLRLRTIAGFAMLLAMTLFVAATAHTQTLLIVLLAAVGAAYLALLTAAQALIQLTTVEAFRGRVLGTYLVVFLGSGCVGGPVLGLLTEHFGARPALLLSGAVPALITALIAQHLARRTNLRLGLATISVQLHRPALVPRSCHGTGPGS